MKSDTKRYVDFRPDLTLGEVRGKILVFNRDDLAPYGDKCFGAFIDGSYGAYGAHNSVGTLSVGGKSESKGHAVCKIYSQDEDNYTLQSDCKEKKYKPFVATAEAYFNDPDYFTWCSNHLSAWVGITPLSMDYYENAQALHPMVINYCKEQKKYHEPGKWRGLGICMMDCAGVDHWPIFLDHEVYGKQMVNALINLNF